ncbi:TadE/TadG family type IV pilus assembly protein [Methylocystis parvus]|uniref:TadE/TadG family type IV pilus assembly protein n=1 Tax=Methylocystis parvus TaxID=134 RepID=UPI001FCAE657|nr:TadE/TadG family type IV pilus assembly protein [Methylocystis parvus]WBK00475.1 pilus assembly protein [Methylocystis parvus OBBP]
MSRCSVWTQIILFIPSKLLRAFSGDRRGNVGIIFALSLVPLLGISGIAIDYGMMGVYRGKLQAAADTGALQAGRELRLAQMGSADSVLSIARNYALSSLNGADGLLSNAAVDAALSNGKTVITVSVTATYTPLLFKSPRVQLSAKASASAVGYPICALALEPAAAKTVYAQTQAQVTAQFCAVQANSKDPHAIYTHGAAQLSAGAICSSGGVKGKFAPKPITDCPVVQDPLASRPAPSVGACAHTNQIVSGGTLTLMPGVYCGGLHVTAGASVTLSPGVYVMSGGPLKVDGGSSFTTNGAGIFLTGAGATLWFGQDTTINLTAPTSGPLAGLLFYEDRDAPAGQAHYIYSDNAPTLHGTIYLPKNQLYVETSKDVSRASAFTIVVANSLFVSKASNLILNSNYKSSDIPVPGGLNPGYVYLKN